MRHDTAAVADDVAPDVRSYVVTHPAGVVRLPNQPGWDQVIYTRSGAFEAVVVGGAWSVPRRRALLVPDGRSVDIRTRASVAVRCLYVRSTLGLLGPSIRVCEPSNLTRELLVHAVAGAPSWTARDPEVAAVVTLLTARLAADADADLWIPLPENGVAAEAARRWLDDPSLSVDEVAGRVGVARRTLERHFLSSIGLSPVGFRRRARVVSAAGLLGRGVDVTRTALEVGYATPSAFVAAFRAETGTTPQRFAAGASPAPE